MSLKVCYSFINHKECFNASFEETDGGIYSVILQSVPKAKDPESRSNSIQVFNFCVDFVDTKEKRHLCLKDMTGEKIFSSFDTEDLDKNEERAFIYDHLHSLLCVKQCNRIVQKQNRERDAVEELIKTLKARDMKLNKLVMKEFEDQGKKCCGNKAPTVIALENAIEKVKKEFCLEEPCVEKATDLATFTITSENFATETGFVKRSLLD